MMMAMAISMATDEDGCDGYVADGEEDDDEVMVIGKVSSARKKFCSVYVLLLQ